MPFQNVSCSTAHPPGESSLTGHIAHHAAQSLILSAAGAGIATQARADRLDPDGPIGARRADVTVATTTPSQNSGHQGLIHVHMTAGPRCLPACCCLPARALKAVAQPAMPEIGSRRGSSSTTPNRSTLKRSAGRAGAHLGRPHHVSRWRTTICAPTSYPARNAVPFSRPSRHGRLHCDVSARQP